MRLDLSDGWRLDMPDINVSELCDEFMADGLPVEGCDSNGGIHWEEGHPVDDEQARADAILAALDPTDHISGRSYRATQEIMSEPQWSDWTYQQAEDWISNQDYSSPAKIKNTFKKMAKMVILLRDKTTPESRGQQPDE